MKLYAEEKMENIKLKEEVNRLKTMIAEQIATIEDREREIEHLVYSTKSREELINMLTNLKNVETMLKSRPSIELEPYKTHNENDIRKINNMIVKLNERLDQITEDMK